ncbi:hypothetical protein EPD60_03900 [Flaviaesturariibacter flavus]|uniref:Uncharacterized protein n=1 Tax=Flaviaesturariibacter flavus TaxID=2502780 RepID=A0A4V2NWT8_9BACT|nr:hypothetical protein [Flaviaesturariibacter flavus]TCJ18652.1 hypothetical protein EPD60_03900 [Flaviaesturariibacter flavus]
MKKTRHIELVLITAALASCHQPKKDWEGSGNRTYLRSDSTAPYTRAHHGGGSALLWYYAFRPYGGYLGNSYNRAGYYSSALHESSNIGSNGVKSGIVRGGFGRSGGYSVSS